MNTLTATSPVDISTSVAGRVDPTSNADGAEQQDTMDDRCLLRTAHRIDRYGIASAECDIAMVVGHANRAGLTGTALAVLRDPSQPDVARARAFGVIATHLWRTSATSSLDIHHAPIAASLSRDVVPQRVGDAHA